MLDLILVILLLQFILFKYNSNVLACGLFGGSFNRPIDEAIANKLKILGYMNQSRGEHSCGYYNGESLHKGIDDKKKFIDLITKDGLILPDNPINNIFIGHTRQATYGSHSYENAHPFNINNELIVAHNGTISNIWSLCTKHGVSYTNIYVDSRALGELLAKKGYSILNEYEGYAALVVHKIDEPNSIYIYHGASKIDEDGEEYEERPLFYLEQPEGIYISSLDHALKFINAVKEKEVKILPHNIIFKITNGTLFKTKVKIDRGNCNVKFKKSTPVHSSTDYSKRYNDYVPSYDVGKKYDSEAVIKNLCKKFPGVQIIDEKLDKTERKKNPVNNLKIESELMPVEAMGSTTKSGKLFFWKGRHQVISESGVNLASGAFVVDKKTGKIIPPEDIQSNISARLDSMYFYRGVKLKSVKAYDVIKAALEDKTSELATPLQLKALKLSLTGESGNFASAISNYSEYPVCLIEGESTKNITCREYWYLNGKFAKSSYTPKFSSRDYVFTEGILSHVNSDDKNKPFTIVVEGFKVAKAKKTINKSMEEITVLNSFNTIFQSVKNLHEGVGVTGLEAINLYITDLCTDLLGISNPTEAQIREHVDDFLEEVIESKDTIKNNMTPMLADPEVYIEEAIKALKDDSPNTNVVHMLPAKVKKTNQISLYNDPDFKKLNKTKEIFPEDLEEESYENDDSQIHSVRDDDDETSFEEEINNIEKAASENEEAQKIIDTIADILEDAIEESYSLQVLDHSTLAKNFEAAFRKHVDSLINEISNECYLAKEKKLGDKYTKLAQL